MMDVIEKIADELKLKKEQVERTVALLKDDAPAPFIAHYRKDQTGGLDENSVLEIKDRHKHLLEFEQRRIFVLKAISDAGKMTPELQSKLEQAPNRAELEDLFMPFRTRRRTRSTAARAKGLEGLAELIWKQQSATGRVEELVKPFLNEEKGVKDLADALSGARDIIAEYIAEDAACRKLARDLTLSEGKLSAKPREGIDLSKGRYATFAGFCEPVSKLAGHRFLALSRGASEKQLSVVIEAPREKITEQLKAKVITNPEAIFKPELVLAVEETYDRLLAPAMDNEIRQELNRRADVEAVEVFTRNLRAMLLQAPLGPKPVLAIGPALKTGCKVVVLDGAGKLLNHSAIYPDKSEDDKKAAAETLLKLIKEHHVAAIAIGNGTGGRETDLFVREGMKNNGVAGVARVLVNESGAAAYSASAAARDEFPELDVTVRSAVSIGRRLQDPLAELVKLDPKSINLGQFQHDVDQNLLKQKLEEVLESCVSAVGVEVNTCGADLLRYITAIGPKHAKSVLETRAKAPFQTREDLRLIPGLEAKEQSYCAGFLRVHGSQPLDATAIHPEAYPTVEAMAASLNVPSRDLLGKADLIDKLELAKFKTDQVGEWMLKDIVAQLKQPQQDVRGQFVNPQFSDEISGVADLKPAMVLNGIVTNLTPFGAFVDIGVHQDGLVHISAITYKFIRDPSEVLSIGQHVKVKVLSVDHERKRISLSMKALQEAPRRPVRTPRAAKPEGAAPEGKPVPSAPAAAQGPRPPRPPRTARPPRPARTGVAGAPGTAQAPVTSGAASSTAPAHAGAAGTPMPVGAAPSGAHPHDRGQRRERGERHDRGAAPRRDGERTPARPAPQGKPDYSKFFVKSKRRTDKEHRRSDDSGASRDEVREILRKQESAGTSLADLLKKAGVVSEDDKAQ